MTTCAEKGQSMDGEKRNTELFFAVADQIEAHPESYDQQEIVNDCGTTGCIAGWAVAIKLWDSDLSEFFNMNGTYEPPEDLLGLTQEEAWGNDGFNGGLFHPAWRPHAGLSVGDALRKIGEGASIGDVSA